ncbi:uncharacterized protein LOC125581456 isoform X2 [Brassica napus]|uniref:uncharacterized protein LOC125581456 isoform X2 n=1 Tax=Brassica napus TaxID=3708 RepID=UPI0020789FAC|nr:uncharacterized protein LOC125581456 isoform X2 [Brassica napus]
MRRERMSLITVCFGSLLSFSRIRSIIGEGEGDSLSLSMIPLRDGHDPSLPRSSRKRDPLSPCLVDETTMLALFVAPREETKTDLSLGGCHRGRKSLIISLSVGVLEVEGPLSASLWIYWNWKVRFFLAVALVDGDIWLCVSGSRQRHRRSLSMAPIRSGLSGEITGATSISCG